MMAMIESHQRYPVQQAQQVIAERLSDGSCVLGIEGLWVNGTEVRPDLDYIADFSPDGLQDLGPITESTPAVATGRGVLRGDSLCHAPLTDRPHIGSCVYLSAARPDVGDSPSMTPYAEAHAAVVRSDLVASLAMGHRYRVCTGGGSAGRPRPVTHNGHI